MLAMYTVSELVLGILVFGIFKKFNVFNFMGFLIFLAIILTIIQLPVVIGRATYFSDKKQVEITYSDTSTKVMFITKTSYKNELSKHMGIKLLDGTTIPESKIYCINLIYSEFTADNGD